MKPQYRILFVYLSLALALVMFVWFSWKLFLAIIFLIVAGILYIPFMENKKPKPPVQ